MSDAKLRALYGLKYNPFRPAIPEEDLWDPPGADHFFWRVENLVLDGGFAVISGEPGLGKSKALQRLARRLEHSGDVQVGVMERPQSSLGDFYRELGDLFGVHLSPANRYGGFKALRARWREHIKSTLFRPVLLIDEAQEMDTGCLVELRLLGSAHFDSECLMTTVLCGDSRLPDRFRTPALMPLGTRVRSRLVLQALEPKPLRELLDHLLDKAGAPDLLTTDLKAALVEHAAGNPRVMTGLGAELLELGVQNNLHQLDDQLFFEHVAPPARRRRTKRRAS